MKKNKKLPLLVTCLLGMLVTLFIGVNTYAEKPGVGYEIRPIIPNTQIDHDRGYYYLQTEPGKKQEFSLSVFNTDDKDKTLEIILEDGISSNQGTIAYSNDPEKKHESLVNPITEIVTLQSNEVTVKPGEEAIVDFTLTPPKEHYEGIKLGRLIVREKEDKEQKGISQSYQYALGIITSESGVAYNDGKTLVLDKAEASIDLGSKVIKGYLYNPEPKTIENLRVRSYVTKKGDSKKIKERNVDNFAFAPNSKVAYQIPWGLSDFESGEYTLHFDAANEYETFKLSKDFTIRADDAKRLNKETAFSISTPYFIIVIIVIINTLLLVLFVVIIKRDKQWVKEIKEKKKKKGSKKKSKKE